MATPEELAILDRYSSPGLRRSILSRYGMRWRLLEQYNMTIDEREALLNRLYPVTPQPYISVDLPNHSV